MAMKRLKRDLIELRRSDLHSIAARPLDHNLFEWHINLRATDGPYSGVYIHLILRFPDSYPSAPPDGMDHPLSAVIQWLSALLVF